MFPRAGQNILPSFCRKKVFSNILLMGPPGCGKTTVGRLLASSLNKKWIDVDDHWLEVLWNMPVAEKLSIIGDESFLDQEEHETQKLNEEDSVISLSGSVPLRTEALKHLSKNSLIVYLDTSLNSIVNRLTEMKVDRIVGHVGRPLKEVLTDRYEVYENSYDIRVVIGENQSPEEISKNVLDAIEARKNTNYHSTRGKDNEKKFHDVIVSGLASDGGLFLPESFLKFSGHSELNRLVDLPYDKLCSRVIEKFPTVIPWRINQAVKEAYETFSHPETVPVTKIGSCWGLETFHGPTASFKDLSLQLLPKLFQHSAEDSANNQSKTPALLVATSGDTGSAALDGFGRTGSSPVIVLYPAGGVSSVQQAQMVRAPGNVCVLGIESDFDWCQAAVKELLSRELPSKYSWTSANSMNFGRLLPQVCFTVHGYLSLVRKKIISMGDPIDVTVPTGNFGFIFAASVAQRMGIPIRKLVCASNDNNVLTEFLRTGKYDVRNRKFYTTISPAIDILVSSNLERWLYMLLRDDPSSTHESAASCVTEMMQNLKSKKFFQVPDSVLKRIQSTMTADWCSESECLQTIKEVWQEQEILIDPHSAVGYRVASKFETQGVPMLFGCTAHWGKFPEAVIESFANEPNVAAVRKHSGPLEQQYEVIQKLAAGVNIPERLLKLIDSPVKHEKVLKPELSQVNNSIMDYIDSFHI